MSGIKPTLRLAAAAALAAAALASLAPRVLAGCVEFAPKAAYGTQQANCGPITGNGCVGVRELAPIPRPHVEPAGVTLGSEIWVVSGSVNSSSNNGDDMPPVAATDIYTPATNTWRDGPAVKIPRIRYPNVFNVNGTLFLIGGAYEVDPASSTRPRPPKRYTGVFDYCRWVEVCRPDGTGFRGLGVSIAAGDKGWYRLPAAYLMPTGLAPIHNMSTAVIGSQIYLFMPRKTVSFNVATGAWRTDLATFPGANTMNSAAVAVNGKIYVSGGGGNPTMPESRRFGEYNPRTDSWRALPSFPAPGLAEHSMEILPCNRLLTVGGDFDGLALFVYDVATNTLVRRESLTETEKKDPALVNRYSRSDHVSGLVNGKLYVVGGIKSGTRDANPATLEIVPPTGG